MSGSKKIKVLVVDDSVLIRKYVCIILESIENIEVVGIAHNGKIALQKIILYKPDVMILDIEMPEMTGLELLKYLKANSKTISAPFIIMFSSLLAQGSSAAIEALNYGAADIIKKPDGQISQNIEFLKKEFEFKINGLYQGRSEFRMPFVPGPVPELPEPEINDPGFTPAVMGLENLGPVLSRKPVRPELIAIASSTGGPPAIRIILEGLDNLNIPVVIAQHMPQGFTLEFAKNLSSIFNREVIELSPNSELRGGVIYICPGGVHSKIQRIGTNFFYQPDYANYDGLFFKPSIDIFFRSLIESAGKNTVGIVLSGMGKDGSIESVNLRKEGAFMIAQDQDSSAIWGMPGSSVKSGGIDIILDIKDIARAVNIIVSGSR
jgi:two-component system chemotaxis response regulator CheB